MSQKDDTISRQAAINALNVGAELLRRVLDDADVVGAERAKYEWGLGLIESYISDIEELPSVQPECDDTVSRKAEIDAIKRYIRGFDAIDVNFLDGLKTAIQIIEQLPHEYSNAQNTLQRVGSVECEDTISRQAAIDAIRRCRFVVDAIEKISKLPSAQPEQPKKGKWTRPFPTRPKTYERFCSECKDKAWYCGTGDYNFCPNCGAGMRGETDETD